MVNQIAQVPRRLQTRFDMHRTQRSETQTGVKTFPRRSSERTRKHFISAMKERKKRTVLSTQRLHPTGYLFRPAEKSEPFVPHRRGLIRPRGCVYSCFRRSSCRESFVSVASPTKSGNAALTARPSVLRFVKYANYA